MLNYIRKYHPVTKSELARETGLTFMAINKIFTEMETLGLIRKNAFQRGGGVGRNAITYTINEHYGYTVGIHINAYRTEVALMDLHGNIHSKMYIEMQEIQQKQDFFINSLVEMVDTVQVQAGIERDSILGIGIGSPGPVDSKTGVIGLAPNIPLLQYLPIKSALEKRCKLKVHLLKDTSTIALGEYWHGMGKSYQDLLYLDIDMGIGGAIVADGKVKRGSGEMAGEIGHMLLKAEEGPLCNCGNRGCLEALSSVIAIKRDLSLELAARKAHPLYGKRNSLTVDAILNAANDGDLLFNQMLQRSAFYVGLAVRNLINILDPQLIILGGVLVQGYAPFFPMVKDIVASHMMRGSSEKTLLVAETNQDMAIIGAGELVSDYFFEEVVFRN
jgi:predicted NBD/HSP70 family sugar kinase